MQVRILLRAPHPHSQIGLANDLTKTAKYIYWPAQLGHRELSMTQRHAHLSPDHMRAVADLTLRRPKAGLVRLPARR